MIAETLTSFRYLAARPESARRQFYVQGRKLPASRVYFDMIANKQSVAEAAWNWDLPYAAVEEIIRYCEENRALLTEEAEAEREALTNDGYATIPASALPNASATPTLSDAE